MTVNTNLDFFQNIQDYLTVLQVNLSSGSLDEKALLQQQLQFQNEQLNFHEKLANFLNAEVTPMIKDSMLEVLNTINEVGNAFSAALAKRHGPAFQSTVRELRSIANSFRMGSDPDGIQKLSIFLSAQAKLNSVEAAIWDALRVVLKIPPIRDIGRSSFYNDAVAPAHKSTPLQKALALELTMLRVVWKAFECGDQQRAYAEFRELPLRLQKEVYDLLEKMDPSSFLKESKGRKIFFGLEGLDAEPAVKMAGLKAIETQLGEFYANANSSDLVVLLQQSLREVHEIEARTQAQLKRAENIENELINTLNTAQHVALRTIKDMQEKILELQQQLEKTGKPIPSMRPRPITRIRSLDDAFEDQRLAEFERKIQELEQEKWELEKRVQANIDEGFVYLDKEPMVLEKGFTKFVQEKCPHYTIEIVQELLRKGKELIRRIQTGEAALIRPDKRKNKVPTLAWYMLYFAVGKNQGLNQEEINFRDPGHAIIKFLLGSKEGDVLPIELFKDRLLPTFFNGSEMTTSYEMNILQDYKKGLPCNCTKLYFGPIKTEDGFDWSCMKLAAWSNDLLSYRIMGYAWNAISLRSESSNDPDLLVKKRFEELYSEVSPKKAVPDEVKKSGMSGMKAILETMLKKGAIPEKNKGRVNEFLSLLRNFDYLSVRRTPSEAYLGDSLIYEDEPKQHAHSSIMEDSRKALLTRDAQMRVKNASHGQELSTALSTLKGLSPLTHVQANVVNEIANGFRDGSSFDQEKIFAQVQRDIMGSYSVNYQVDGKTFKDSAANLYRYFLFRDFAPDAETQEEKQQEILRFMTLCQQGVTVDLIGQLQHWYEQAVQGVHILQKIAEPGKFSRHFCIYTGDNPSIEITQQFKLVGSDQLCPLFYSSNVAYALIKGTVKVSLKEQTARISATIEEVYEVPMDRSRSSPARHTNKA